MKEVQENQLYKMIEGCNINRPSGKFPNRHQGGDTFIYKERVHGKHIVLKRHNFKSSQYHVHTQNKILLY